jgi:hypothetical protein
VLDDLADDPLLSEIEVIAQRHSQVDELEPPDGCDAATVVRVGDPGPAPTTPTGLPNGTYRVEISQQDVVAAGFGEDDSSAGLWTLTIADDTYRLDCTPVSPPGNIDCWYGQVLPADFVANPRLIGPVTGDQTTAFFVHDPALEAELTDCDPDTSGKPSSCGQEWPTKVSWQLDGDTLTFSAQVATEPAYPLVVKPWTRIG